MHPPTRHLFDCDFVTDVEIADLVELLRAEEEPSTEWRCTVTPNVDHLVRYQHHPVEAEVAQHATLLLPDGMPIVWASRKLGRPLTRRLAGSDLFAELWPSLARDRVPTVVLASSDQVAELLRAEHPAATVVVPPFFDVADDAAVTAVVDDLDAACAAIDAHFLFICVSMPKHHLLASRLRTRWQGRRSPHVLLLGASPDFYLGIAKRAPEWMQKASLEWLHRLASEPRRMARRYLIDDPEFVRLYFRERRALRRDVPSSVDA